MGHRSLSAIPGGEYERMERMTAKKKKDIHDMTIVELLNHYYTTIDKDGNLLKGHEETYEMILNEWPFCKFEELENQVEELEAEIRKLQKHVHLPDGTIAIKM